MSQHSCSPAQLEVRKILDCGSKSHFFLCMHEGPDTPLHVSIVGVAHVQVSPLRLLVLEIVVRRLGSLRGGRGGCHRERILLLVVQSDAADHHHRSAGHQQPLHNVHDADDPEQLGIDFLHELVTEFQTLEINYGLRIMRFSAASTVGVPPRPKTSA